MDTVLAIGLAAGTLTTIGYVPQLAKIIRTKSARDVSLMMFLIISIGVFLWFLYGLYINSLPVIIANVAVLALTISIAFFKIKYLKREKLTNRKSSN